MKCFNHSPSILEKKKKNIGGSVNKTIPKLNGKTSWLEGVDIKGFLHSLLRIAYCVWIYLFIYFVLCCILPWYSKNLLLTSIIYFKNKYNNLPFSNSSIKSKHKIVSILPVIWIRNICSLLSSSLLPLFFFFWPLRFPPCTSWILFQLKANPIDHTAVSIEHLLEWEQRSFSILRHEMSLFWTLFHSSRTI